MNCLELQRFGEAFVDGEFDEGGEAEFSAHLNQCPLCRQEIAELQGFKEYLQEHVELPAAPAHLKASINGELDRAAKRSGSGLTWAGLAAAVLAAAVLILPNLERPGNIGDLATGLVPHSFVEESVDWHQRNLPIEVTGPDERVISEWFRDKVDFPVRLPEFINNDVRFSVLGGRLSHIENRSAAHVTYEVEGLEVSIILFRAENLTVPNFRAENLTVPNWNRNRPGDSYAFANSRGYNVAFFNDNGVTYTITTDMPQTSFANLVRTVQFPE